MTAGSNIVFSNGDRIMAANMHMANSSLPNKKVIFSQVRRVYRTVTEEVPRERSRVSGGNSSNVENELSRKPPLCNPRVNYGSNDSSGKKWRLRSSSWKGKSAKESPHSISCKELGGILI